MAKRKDEAPAATADEVQEPEAPAEKQPDPGMISLCAPAGVESVGHSAGVLEVKDGKVQLDRIADRDLIQTLVRSCGFTEAAQ